MKTVDCTWPVTVTAVLAIGIFPGCGKIDSSGDLDAQVAPTDANTSVDAPPVDASLPDSTITTAVSLHNVATFAAPDAVYTKVPYVGEAYDDGDEYDTTTSRFTPTADGDYQFCASLYLAGTDFFELFLYKNGERAYGVALATDASLVGCRAIRLGAGDYVELWLYQESGGAATITPSNNFHWLTIYKLSSLVAANATMPTTAPNATFVRVLFDSELHDNGDQFDATQSRFVAAADGDYEVCASKTLSRTHDAEIDLFINGNRENALGYETLVPSGCRTVRLAASDVVEVWMHHENGVGTLTFPPNPWDWITVQRASASVSVVGIATFSAPGGTFTKVPYTGEQFDDDAQFDVGTSTFTADAAGDYKVCAMLHDRDPALFSEIDLFTNGTREMVLAAGTGPTGGCRVVRLRSGDQVHVGVHHPGSTPVTFSSGAAWFWFQVSRVL